MRNRIIQVQERLLGVDFLAYLAITGALITKEFLENQQLSMNQHSLANRYQFLAHPVKKFLVELSMLVLLFISLQPRLLKLQRMREL